MLLQQSSDYHMYINLFLTFFLCELVKETGFAYTHIPNDDVFEDVGVVVRSRRHFEGLQGLPKSTDGLYENLCSKS